MKKLLLILFFVFCFTGTASAHPPGLPNPLDMDEGMFADDTYFTKVPALIGGIAVGLPCAVVGGVLDIVKAPFTGLDPLCTMFGGLAGVMFGQFAFGVIPHWIEKPFKPNKDKDGQ